MESPVRSVETTAGSGENGGSGGGKEDSAAESSSSQRFEAKSYLERQVEELSCADEDEAQEKVSQRLQLKQERAKKKRDIQLQRRRKGIAERLHKIREAREAVDARFAENALQLMERQAEKQTSATRRRRTSLENIKKARAVHNRRVNQRRRESFDDASGESPARIKGMHEFESKLARAERNRENLRRERRRRAMERYEEGKARALEQGASSSTSSGGGGISGIVGAGGGSGGLLLRAFGATSSSTGAIGGGGSSGGATTTTSSATTTGSASVKAGRENRRRRAVEARQAAKARQTKRMRDLRQRMLSQRSPRVSERKTRVFAARLLQEWWRCVRVGKAFSVTDLAISSPDGSPLQRSPLGSPSAWATTQGLGLSLTEGLGAALMAGDQEGGVGGGFAGGFGAAGFDAAGSAALEAKLGVALDPLEQLDPCTRSPLPTVRKFSPGVGGGMQQQQQRGFGFAAGLGSGGSGGGGGGSGGGGGGGSASGGGGGGASGGGVGFGVGVGAGSVGACSCSAGAGAGSVGAGAGAVGTGAGAVGAGAGSAGAGGVGSKKQSASSGTTAVAAATAEATTDAAARYGFGSNHKAALAIQSFLRRNMHSLKVANALLAGRLSVKVLCAAVRTMATSTFDEAIEVMSTRAIVSHCETALKALRMGREMRSVPQTVRSARAFLSALLVNFFPTSALDDEGALSSSPEGTSPLQLEKDRLVRASGNAIKALLELEATMDAAAAAAAASAVTAGGGVGGGGRSGRVGGGGVERERVASSAFRVEQFPKIRRASATMVRARVAFCRRFAEWKRKDAMRLADEMTAASVDVLFMQLRAERDLQVAAARYGIEDTDDGGALFSTGFEQIKEGTQRQLGKMMHALGKLVGPTEARQRMDRATDAAFERLRADELAEDEEFLREHGEFADERMDTDDGDYHHRHHHHGSSSSAHLSGAEAAAGGMDGAARAGGAVSATEAAAALLGKGVAPEEEDDIAGPRRPLSAGDLLSNEWLVHEVMISDETLTVTLEEAVENQLLRSGSPAAAAAAAVGNEDGVNLYWETVERHVAAEDYTPLLGLVAELRDKIIGLTPRRRDLAAETCEAMDVELLEQMVEYGAFDVGCFFRMVAFAGERVLELEAPIRNEGTKATLAGWGRTQDEVEGGRRQLEPAMVRECFEYLFSKTDEIHVDILNAHLQFVTPFLKQHGVEYERDRFTEKLDAGETSLDMTHLWLHRAIRQLRSAAGVPPNGAATVAPTAVGGGGGGGAVAVAPLPTPPPSLTAAAAAEVKFYRQLLSDLDQRRGDAYLKLLRVAIVDNLLGAIVCVERKSGGGAASAAAPPPQPPSPPSPPPPPSTAAGAAGSGKAAPGARAGGVGGGGVGVGVDLHTMPKRTGLGDDTGGRDAPEVIATRRKAKVSSRFRRTNTPLPTDAMPAAAPSAFAGMAGNPPKSGFVFGSMGATNEPASTRTAFSFGASTSGGTAGAPTPAAIFAPTPAAAVFAPPPAAAVFAPTPAAAVFAPTPAASVLAPAVSSPATNLFSVQDNAAAAAPVVFSKPLQTEPLPVRLSTGVQPVAVALKAPAGIIASGGSGLAFGEGRTAAQGVRLNKLFVRWIAHQLSTNSASTLDTGLRDYMTFAAEIRDRVETLGGDSGSAASASFTQPSASTATTSETGSSANPSTPSTAATATPARLAAVPAPIAAPAPVPAPVATTTPAFTFSSPSTLPAAPSGPQFSFGLQTAAASTKATGAPAVIAPSATSPAPTGFKLNNIGFGGFGAAPGSVFNGFQAPAGVGFAPAAPAMAAGGAATEAEDDGMPKEDPSKLERAPGEEDEEVVCHFRAKLYRFKLDEKSWGDLGTGLLRLMKHTTNGGRRLVLRNDMGKVLLNAGFYEGMKVTKTKNAVKFIANIAGDGPTSVMIKVTANEIQELHTSMLALVPP